MDYNVVCWKGWCSRNMYSETVERSLSQKYLTNTKEWCVGRHTWSILQGYYPKIASSCSYSLADTWQGSCCLMRKQLIHHSKVAKLTMSTHGFSTANPYILWWKWHNNYNSLTVRMYFNWFHYFEQGKGPNPCIGLQWARHSMRRTGWIFVQDSKQAAVVWPGFDNEKTMMHD